MTLRKTMRGRVPDKTIRTIHGLEDRKALCGFSNLHYKRWPEGHIWVPAHNISRITCPLCKAAAERQAVHQAEEGETTWT